MTRSNTPRLSGIDFIVYWVHEGMADTFSLSDFSVTPIAFDVRHLEFVYLIRRLFGLGPIAEFRVELTERACLKVMADLALRRGHVDLAVLTFLKSAVGKGIHLPDTDTVMDLEAQQINEGYMATWFFALIHELGHLVPRSAIDGGEVFDDDWIRIRLESRLEHFPYPPELKQDALARAAQRGTEFVLEYDRLRIEGMADIFATSVLFQTTVGIMAELKQQEFNIAKFIAEIMMFLNAIGVIHRCKQVVSIASTAEHDPARGYELAFHPVAMAVRAEMVRGYLSIASAAYLVAKSPSAAQMDLARAGVDKIIERLKASVDQLDSGMARAMHFALFPEKSERDLLRTFAEETRARAGKLLVLEARRFLKTVDTFGANSAPLSSLRTIVGN